MILLILFAFVSGVITILAPCIWPILPLIFVTSGGTRKKSTGVALGIVTSFAFFTLLVSYIARIIPIDPDNFRIAAVTILIIMGLTLAIPKLNAIFESYISRFINKININPNSSNTAVFGKGFLTGLALGAVWSPCAGPILATIAVLASTQQINFQILIIILFYAAGLFVPLFLFSILGNKIVNKARTYSKYTSTIQRIFGILVILFALGIATNYDKVIQAKLLDLIPSYSEFLYKLEQNPNIQQELDKLQNRETSESYGAAPELTGISNWLNTENPLTLNALKGKVVLIDFWTYTCINCIRTLPHVTNWYEKYKDKGLVVIGVHTPEFEFEKKTENVLNAIKMFNINYPVAQDNDYLTWRAYKNRYWPAHYLIDSNGVIRMVHFGEGKYKETEAAIQELLKESGMGISEELSGLKDETPTNLQTPEIYLGLDRLEAMESNEKAAPGINTYTINKTPNLHKFSLVGMWNMNGEYSEASENSELILNFLSSKVFLVISPANPGDKVITFLDDKPYGEITLDMERLYKLVDLQNNWGIHTLRLQFKSSGIKVFAFTFE